MLPQLSQKNIKNLFRPETHSVRQTLHCAPLETFNPPAEKCIQCVFCLLQTLPQHWPTASSIISDDSVRLVVRGRV